jgi:hypothetical protein
VRVAGGNSTYGIVKLEKKTLLNNNIALVQSPIPQRKK